MKGDNTSLSSSQDGFSKGRENSESSRPTLSIQDKEALQHTNNAEKERKASGQSLDQSTQRADVDPLHNESGKGVNYKSCSWWHCGMLMIAEVISLGILSLPSSIAALGILPGLLCIFGLGALATYSGYVIGQFKLRYPNVYTMADAGFILFGNLGYWIFYAAAQLSLIFIMAAHIVTFDVAMNVLTDNATCSMVWAVVGVALSIILTLPRTFKNVSYLSITSFLSITAAVFIVMVAVGISKSKRNIDVGTFSSHYSFHPTVMAILNITIAYMGNVAFFTFISELKDPRDFPKSLYLLQGCSISFYAIVALVIYYYVGESVPSPALGAASPTIRKIAWGVGMPTIIVAGVVNASVACKSLYVQLWRWLRKPDMVKSRSLPAVASWAGIVAASWVLAGLLALAIPIFFELLGLISAVFGSWFTYGCCCMFWVKMNWVDIKRLFRKAIHCGYDDDDEASLEAAPWTWNKSLLFVLNIGMMLLCVVMCGLGLCSSIKTITENKVGKPFSCLEL